MSSSHSSSLTDPLLNAPFVLVVGIDLDATGDQVLAAALPYARYFPKAEVHVVHVVTDVSEAMKEETNAQSSLLDERVQALRDFVLMRWPEQEANVLSVRLHVGLGKAAAELVQVATDVNADLILTGHHDRSMVADLLQSSVSDSLVHTAPCPVLVVRDKNYEGRTRSPAIEPPHAANVTHNTPPHPMAHTYHYRRTLPLRTPDTNVIPTGV